MLESLNINELKVKQLQDDKAKLQQKVDDLNKEVSDKKHRSLSLYRARFNK